MRRAGTTRSSSSSSTARTTSRSGGGRGGRPPGSSTNPPGSRTTGPCATSDSPSTRASMRCLARRSWPSGAISPGPSGSVTRSMGCSTTMSSGAHAVVSADRHGPQGGQRRDRGRVRQQQDQRCPRSQTCKPWAGVSDSWSLGSDAVLPWQRTDRHGRRVLEERRHAGALLSTKAGPRLRADPVDSPPGLPSRPAGRRVPDAPRPGAWRAALGDRRTCSRGKSASTSKARAANWAAASRPSRTRASSRFVTSSPTNSGRSGSGWARSSRMRILRPGIASSTSARPGARHSPEDVHRQAR